MHIVDLLCTYLGVEKPADNNRRRDAHARCACPQEWIDANKPIGGNAIRTGDSTFRTQIVPNARFMASRSGAKIC